jgi:Asp-tRNA(Asn)/Glu-tRNA(Gln) amidotransferase C subunit
MLKKQTIEKYADLAHLEIEEDKKEKIRKDISNV